MKSLGIILALQLVPVLLHAQVIRGRILDAETRDPVAHAAVYVSGTFLGTSSDEQGTFQLDVTMFSSMPVTISAVGYYSHEITDFTKQVSLNIHLRPRVYEIGEVEIRRRLNKKQRKKNLNLFRREFLGTTSNSRSCEILNEEDILFYSNLQKDTVWALAREPIRIHNRALGYHIRYYLDEFVCCKKGPTLYFSGNILFSEDKRTYRRFTERKRRIAYRGSRMHFFRALWANELSGNHFTVNNTNGDLLTYEDIVFTTDGQAKFLHYPDGLIILYYKTVSSIDFHEQYAFFDKEGYYDASCIGWNGHMSNKRIGDQLPYEYNPEE